MTNANSHPLSDNESATLLNSYFTTVFTSENTNNIPSLDPLSHPEMCPIEITYQGIVKAIQNLKTSSSSSDDQINSKLLKNTKHVSSQFLTLIFAQSLPSGQLPTNWRVGRVIPIFKAGDRNLPSNYHPISLTSISCKLLEHILYSNIIQYLDYHNLLFKNQHGFRKHFSCDTQLIQFIHDLQCNSDRNTQTDIIFIDFSKAFDKVPHKRLLHKLTQLRVHSSVITWIADFLSNRT